MVQDKSGGEVKEGVRLSLTRADLEAIESSTTLPGIMAIDSHSAALTPFIYNNST